jgi:hypothetical protein
MPASIPPKVLELSTRFEFGASVQTHHAPTVMDALRKAARHIFPTAIICAAFVVFFLYRASSLTGDLLRFLFFVLFWVIFLGMFQVVLAESRVGRNQRVYEYTGGIIVTERRKQDLFHTIPWEDITAFTGKLPVYEITVPSGKTCKIYCETVVPHIEQKFAQLEQHKQLVAKRTRPDQPAQKNRQKIRKSR